MLGVYKNLRKLVTARQVSGVAFAYSTVACKIGFPSNHTAEILPHLKIRSLGIYLTEIS
jgi:hypothetical protein